MPIGRDEWSKRRTKDTLESLIESFLKSNSNNAFTISEIVSGLYTLKYEDLGDWIGAFASFYAVNTALDNLVKEKKVQKQVVSKRYGTDTYYMIA